MRTLSANLESLGRRTADRGGRIAEEAGELALLAAHSLRSLATPPWETSAWLVQMEQVVAQQGLAALDAKRLLELKRAGFSDALVETGYHDFVAHEFIPTWEDTILALRHAAMVCDV